MYQPQDETLSDWAQRKMETAMQDAALAKMQASVPQTQPVGYSALVESLRNLASLIEAAEAARGPIVATPNTPEVSDALFALNENLGMVYPWFEEMANG